MSRKAKKIQHTIMPDPTFGSVVAAKFINHIMLDGKKTIAEKIFYGALKKLEEVGKEKKISSFDLFINALESLKPKVKMKSRRVGGATYQVPRALRETESEMIAMKWLITSARSIKGSSMEQGLFNVIKETLEGRGAAVKKKEEVHKSAEANKAFAHFA